MNPCFFSIKPNLMAGRFFFYFGPWDRFEDLKTWYLAHGTTDFHNRIKDHCRDGVSDAEHFDGMVYDPCPGHPLLVMKVIPHTPKEIGYLVHEIHHAVQRWTESLGIYTSRDSEEVFAYTEGELLKIVLDYLWHGTLADGLDPCESWTP